MSLQVDKFQLRDETVKKVIIMCGDKEMIELKENGDIYVKGELVENNIEVVDGMRELLHCHKIKRSE